MENLQFIDKATCFQFPHLIHQVGCMLHLPQGLTFTLIPTVAIKCWLGLPVSEGNPCPQCMSHSLDHFGH